MSNHTTLRDHVRHVFWRTTEGSVTYRVTVKRESAADRAAYVNRARSLTDGLETSIRDAGSGSFESVDVSPTADPYSRTMTAIHEVEERVADFEARLGAVEIYGDSGGWLSPSVRSMESDLDSAAKSLEALYDDRDRTANTLAYTVSFAPKSPTTVEAITSEFDRLGALDGVEAVERESATPTTDPRTSIDFTS